MEDISTCHSKSAGVNNKINGAEYHLAAPIIVHGGLLSDCNGLVQHLNKTELSVFS